jgi:hypothetical protein
MSENYIDVDFRGQVDTVHRKFELTARQAAQMFGEDNLSPKMREAYADRAKCDSAQVPDPARRPAQRAGRRRQARLSRQGDREPLHRDRRKMASSARAAFHDADPGLAQLDRAGQKYGSSPMFKVLGTAAGLNEIAKTILRAGHKAVDPALAFFDDGDISKLVTKPGGLNPGLVNEEGRLLVQPIPSGGNHGSAATSRKRARGGQDRVPRGLLPHPHRSRRSLDRDAGARDGRQAGRADRALRRPLRNRKGRRPGRARARYPDARRPDRADAAGNDRGRRGRWST